jgi:phage terminase small subunit
MALPSGLSPKQEKFANAYLDSGNATESVIEAGYNATTYGSAATIGSENLKKVDIIAYLQENANKVASNMLRLALSAESEQVQVQAGKDVLDRAGFKPTDKADVTMTMSVAKDIADKFE